MPTLYSYIVRYDDGFAPNPFHGICTLACCKRPMRPYPEPGDYVVGLGKKALGNRVVYAMQVSETVTFDEYWHDPRFRAKRPDMRAGGEKALGDNIYHWDAAKGEWHKEFSHHTRQDPAEDRWFTEDDTGTDRVLIGEDFIYWGGDGPLLPDNLQGIILDRQGYRSTSNEPFIPDFIKWFSRQKERGCLGTPTSGLPAPITGRATRKKNC